MIDWTKFPKRFTLEAIDRFVFVPESATHASEEQVRALLDDAEAYIHKSGEHERTPGLGISARAVVRVCRQALRLEDSKQDAVPQGEPSPDPGTAEPARKHRRPSWVSPTQGAESATGGEPS
ncbi:MAG: hypothetical protein IT532_11290 [Burkholderiales bacterium]|nr:hypothetical protein [Burkholderiales bacterium]